MTSTIQSKEIRISEPVRTLILEDDVFYSTALTHGLHANGFTSRICRHTDDFITLIQKSENDSQPFHILLVNPETAGRDERNFQGLLNEQKIMIPVIYLHTTSESEQSRTEYDQFFDLPYEINFVLDEIGRILYPGKAGFNTNVS